MCQFCQAAGGPESGIEYLRRYLEDLKKTMNETPDEETGAHIERAEALLIRMEAEAGGA